MGYNVHITRAYSWPFSNHYPITNAEWLALAGRRSDIVFDPDDRSLSEPHLEHLGEAMWLWAVHPDHPDDPYWLYCHGGRAHTKLRETWSVEHMLTIAAEFDAWVVGDDSEPCVMTDEGPAQLPYEVTAFPFPNLEIRYEYSDERNFDPATWIDAAGQWTDFEIRTEIEAFLPSGRRLISCAPTAFWTGHPSGEPIPYFDAGNSLNVWGRDAASRRRAKAVAEALGMSVFE